MRLLLIEDYPPLQKSVAKGLREAGFAVDVAGDGKNGLWYARSNDYDVIVLDLLLPELDGLSLLRQLRADGLEVHVLVLTAKDTVADRVAGLDAGADDYLVKPFAFEELLARVQSLVRRRYQQKSPILTVRDIRLDTAAQRAWRGDEEVVLTGREYALLEYLVRRVGQTVTRADIWEHVYDFADSTTSNVVDVYVGYLRRKLDRPGEPSMSRTVRGRGYCLEESTP